LSTGIEATTEVSDDLLQAKSKGKQAANDFVVNRCSSNPTSDYFDPLKKAKLKSFKDLKAVCKVRNKDLVLPFPMDRDVFARMALLGRFGNCFNLSSWYSSLVSCRSLWSPAKDKQSQTLPTAIATHHSH